MRPEAFGLLPPVLRWHCAMLALMVVMQVAGRCGGEVFTSLADMERLVDTEARLIASLDRAIAAEVGKIEKLKVVREQYRQWNAELRADSEAHVHNPINAYLLVKRLSHDWRRLSDIVTEDTIQPLLEELKSSEGVRVPDEEDLAGAVSALVRLQDTYRLNTSDLARGELEGSRVKRPLSAYDCFELGRQLYLKQDFKHTALWMQEARRQLILENQQEGLTSAIATVSEADVLEYLAFSVYKLGNVLHALQLTNQLLQLQPAHERALGNKVVYEKEVREKNLETHNDDVEAEMDMDELTSGNSGGADWHHSQEFGRYEALCRGDIAVSPRVAKKLRCFYTHNGAAFLLLQPVAVEELFDSPRLVVFHNVVSDSEIAIVQRLAAPRMARATVQNSVTGALETANYRVSKSAWLKSEDHTVVDRLNSRVAQLTGLNMKTAEDLQVSNYGIGGHYEPHFDFARKEETNAFKSLGTGNRIATFMFYLSDVPLGGATVFTTAGVTVWPRRGSAAFWYNLRRNGDGDVRTRHAACPVLLGNKWVANIWMHERGQEFTRQCSTEPHD